MVGLLFYLGRFIQDASVWSRTVAILLGHATLAVWYLIARDFIPKAQVRTWLMLALFCPMTGLGGIIITPDLPLLFFWSLTTYFALRILDQQDGRDFFAFGLSLGLGFCSKYHIVLFPLAGLLLCLNKNFRHAFLQPKLALTFGAGLLACSPVLGWNAAHDWASFKFQIAHGLESNPLNLRWPAEYLLGQALLIFPAVLYAAFRSFRGASDSVRLIAVTSFFPLAFFLYSSFRAPVELNWPIMVYPGLFVLASLEMKKWGRLSALGLWSAVQVALLVALFFPARFHLHEKLSEPTRYLSLKNLPKENAPLYASTYQIASSLWYASNTPVYKLRGMTRPDMFDYWPQSAPDAARFYLLMYETDVIPEPYGAYQIRRISSPAPQLQLVEVTRP